VRIAETATARVIVCILRRPATQRSSRNDV
jgi:hypothetical protein